MRRQPPIPLCYAIPVARGDCDDISSRPKSSAERLCDQADRLWSPRVVPGSALPRARLSMATSAADGVPPLSAPSRGRVRERVQLGKRVAFEDAGVPGPTAISALPHFAIGEAGE